MEASPEELVDEINLTTFTEVDSHQGQRPGDEVDPVTTDTNVSVDTQAQIGSTNHNNENVDENSKATDKNVSVDSHLGQKSGDEVDPVTTDKIVRVDTQTHVDNVDHNIENVGEHSKVTVYRILNRAVLEKVTVRGTESGRKEEI